MKAWVKWIISGLIIVLLIVIGLGWIKINKLQSARITEQESYELIIDSLNKTNNRYLYIIDSISLSVTNLEKEIEIIKETKEVLETQLYQFEFTSDLDENVILLRENIWKHSQ